jgi:hypothetical protein
MLRQPGAGLFIACLGSLAQGEECFMAASSGARPGNLSDLLQGEIGSWEFTWGMCECAVATSIAAQLGQRNEYLG